MIDTTQPPATTKYQRDLMAHSLGLGRKPKPYRNYFCAAAGSLDANEIDRLIAMGLMVRGPTINEGRDFYAFVTAAGAAELGVELPGEGR